jgi:hypothetical protein
MRARELLEFQINGSFNVLAERLERVRDSEWSRRAIPGTSLLGFILWHGARTIDWAVHTAVRGVPEVAAGERWAGRLGQRFGYGSGITLEEADEAAGSVDRELVRDYLEDLRGAVMGWLRGLDDGELERVPAMKEQQKVHPRYLEPAVWSEVANMDGIPAWQILARPAMAHIRVHAGEFDALLQGLRVAKA